MEGKPDLYPIPQSTITWLLDSQTPSIRYLTHTYLLARSSTGKDLIRMQAEITSSDYFQRIAALQEDGGFWYHNAHYYQPKYRGSHWSMLMLAELAVPPHHDVMQNGAYFLLKRMEYYKDYNRSIPSYFQEEGYGFTCFWGNFLRYQIYCGNLDHPLVQKIIKYVCHDIHQSCRCEYNEDMVCAWGVIRGLFGLALIPDNQRSPEIKDAIKHGINFILKDFELINADYPSPGKVHPLWHKLSFPLYYQADIFFTLRVLAELNALNHPGAKPALDWLSSKRGKDSKWRGGSPYKSRSHPFLTPPDSPGHWVTLHVLSVLSAANRQRAE